jgi:eukaryotic-like serine/threonine-protein kinase
MNPTQKHSKLSMWDSGHAQSGDVKIGDDDRIYISEGDVIGGKYVVERLLGVGGIGFVVAARHQELGGYFALKFLKKRFLRQPQIVERFTREARASCRIQSDYVARVYDVGVDDGVPFLVMEYLTGRDLATVLTDGGRLNVDDAVEYAIHACVALSVAHAHGIVHRDIKPENLFLVEREGLSTVKLLDFGISKVTLSELGDDRTGARLTGSLALGTPFYMSPEQIRSTATADARSDLWSLGVVLYELLASNAAFGGAGVTEVCAAILEREPVSLSELRPEIPEGLVAVVSRCLQKDPADRFRNVAELAVALLPFAPLRALAVAEGSASIRRAAIHAIGGSAEALGAPSSRRSSGAMRISGAFAAPDPAVVPPVGPQPVPAPASSRAAPARRHRVALITGAAVLVVALVTAAAQTMQAHGRPAPDSRAASAGPGPVAQPVDAVAVGSRPAPSAVLEPQTDPAGAPPGAPVLDAPRAPPHPARAAPAPRVAPLFQPARAASTGGRAAATAKPVLAEPSTTPSVASPSAPPPSTRVRPDVGY